MEGKTLSETCCYWKGIDGESENGFICSVSEQVFMSRGIDLWRRQTWRPSFEDDNNSFDCNWMWAAAVAPKTRYRRKELIVVSSKEGVYACLCGRALRGSWPFGRRCICPTRHTMSLLYFVYSRAIHLLVLLLLFCKKCVRSIVRLLFCSLIRSLF